MCKLSSAGASALVGPLTRLTQLDLSGNGLAGLPAALAALGELRVLRLERCALDNGGAMDLAATLPRLARLEQLWLWRNLMDRVGVTLLVQAVSTHASMKRLVIDVDDDAIWKRVIAAGGGRCQLCFRMPL